MTVRAVIFDFVGTLVNCKGYSMEASQNKLYDALAAQGFKVPKKEFFSAYTLAHEKYRKVRYEELQEVTNAVWVAEALTYLGLNVKDNDCRVKAGLNIFFKDFIDSLELREGAKTLVKKAGQQYKIGLISNFTYAPVIYKSLTKLAIGALFNVVTVSQEVGWRKPHGKIFQDTLKKLDVQAHEALYIGDSPIEDIKGAADAGLRTVFIPSQFNSIKDLAESRQKPNYLVNELREIAGMLDKF